LRHFYPWTIFEEAAMPAPKTLRAVAPGEKPEKSSKPASSVTQAVVDGDQRAQLVAMRARIARAIDEPNIRGADLAALSRRLLEIAKEIEAIDARLAEEAREDAESTPDDAWEAV
jgi:hypothetical protein